MNFEEDVKVDVSDKKLETLAFWARLQVNLEKEIADKEEAVATLKARLKHISEGEIPSLMMEIGMSSFKLTNGSTVTTKQFYDAKLDDSNMEEGAKWLRENGHGALIKKTLTIDFDKAEGPDWDALVTEVALAIQSKAGDGLDFTAKLKQAVHHATLKAFVKEQVESGVAFPRELFKTYIGTKTIIKAGV